jgi:DtxR family Mn-dependent transcriptional regulator
VSKILSPGLKTGAALSASQEDYLEAIFNLLLERPAVRARDLARRLGVSGASVTVALRALAARGLVHYAPYELVTLTPEGRAAARRIVRRHQVLRDFFADVLEADPAEAEACACRVEHVLSADLFDRLRRFAETHRQRSGTPEDVAERTP